MGIAVDEVCLKNVERLVYVFEGNGRASPISPRRSSSPLCSQTECGFSGLEACHDVPVWLHQLGTCKVSNLGIEDIHINSYNSDSKDSLRFHGSIGGRSEWLRWVRGFAH